MNAIDRIRRAYARGLAPMRADVETVLTQSDTLHAAGEALWRAVGETGWNSGPPTVSERRRRTEIMNAARAALTEAQ